MTILIPITILTVLLAYLLFCIHVNFTEKTDLNGRLLQKYKIMNNSVIQNNVILILTTSPILVMGMFLNELHFIPFLYNINFFN